ncbi:hypothetical protein [Herbidospora cretacea]|uniref:hypothetical protein n=1 Tax=Herbidospora cretacea TaxID=28444 RepID=UPI000773AB86|nr:hypothetical protein [Herbidospora cretacea]
MAVSAADAPMVRIGFGVTRKSLLTADFPVSVAGRPRVYMDLSYRMFLDLSTGRLRMVASAIAISAADENRSRLCHWDYERDKDRGYPDAHLHIHGKSDAEIFWRPRLVNPGLDNLHFPVGGRRFRPTLEDVITFLVREGICEGRDGWWERVDSSRAEYERQQLGAAIRCDEDGAVRWLRDLGYGVTPPA